MRLGLPLLGDAVEPLCRSMRLETRLSISDLRSSAVFPGEGTYDVATLAYHRAIRMAVMNVVEDPS